MANKYRIEINLELTKRQLRNLMMDCDTNSENATSMDSVYQEIWDQLALQNEADEILGDDTVEGCLTFWLNKRDKVS